MDEIVSRVSPSLAFAAYKANLSTPAKNAITQYSYVFDKHRELLNAEPEDAFNEFQQLDPGLQETLKALFGETDYSNKPVNWTLGKKFVEVLKSPFRSLYGAAVNYTEALNTPVRGLTAVLQGEPITSKKTWTYGWDGRSVFDRDEVAKLDEQYGVAIGTIARGLAQGKTPGETLADEGELTEELIRAMDLVFNEPELFGQILNQYKNAQLSPGRVITRAFMGNRATSDSLYNVAFNTFSGTFDAAYQILLDPLTYVTFGIAPLARLGLTKSQRLGQLVSKGQVGVREVFKDPEVKQVWNELGAVLKQYSEAKTPVAKARQREIIARDFSAYDEQSTITLLSDAKVYDAKAAEDFFAEMENFNLLFSGRVSNVDMFRGQSVLAATKSREIKKKIVQTTSSFWKGVTQKGDLTSQQKELFAQDFIKALTDIGEDTSLAAAKASDLSRSGALAIAEDSLVGFRKLTNKLRIHPGFRGIKVTNPLKDKNGKIIDAGVDETLDVVESLAGLTMSKPLGRIFGQLFRNLNTPGDRVLALRGLYTYTLHRMGIGAMEGGDDFIRQLLDEKFADAAGFLSKEESLFPRQFEDIVKTDPTTGAVKEMQSFGAVHAYNETPTIGQIDWIQVGRFASGQLAREGIGSKTEFLKRAGKLTNSPLVQFINDTWTFFTLVPKLGIKSTIDEQLFFMLFAQKEAMWNYLSLRGRQAATIAGVTLSGPSKFISFMRDKLKNYSGAISDEARAFIIKENTNPENVNRALGVKAVEEVTARSRFTPMKDIEIEDTLDGLEHNAMASAGVTANITNRGGLGGPVEIPYINLDPNNTLTKKIETLGGTIGSTFTRVSDNLDKRQRATVQWYETIKRFGFNKFRIGNKTYFNPALSFFKFNGFRRTEDITLAIDDAMEKVGFKKAGDTWEISEAKKVSAFNGGSADAAVKRKYGQTEVDIAKERITLIFADLFNQFNGGPEKAFNQKLWDLVNSKIAPKKVGPQVKAITGIAGRKGTPMGDAKDIAMRSESDAAIVELQDVARQAEIKVAEPKGLGKSSSETSLLRLGPATGNLSGKTIMLARNGKLSGQPLRAETIESIQAAHKAGAKFVVGDMPGVDDVFYKILDDLDASYTVFHTGAKPRTAISKDKTVPGDSITGIFRDLDFEDFFVASQDNLISGPFKTNIQFAGTDSVSSIAKARDKLWELMDRQVTALHRQPAWWSMYLAKREIYRQAELDYVDVILQKDPEFGLASAKLLAKKRYTEIASQEATNELLKFVDNPSIRSQLAWSARNIGRFYRATEDFMRRVYRLRKASLPVLYRLRLASLGLEGTGFIHEDAQGERYVMLPMDDFMFQALNPIMTTIAGGSESAYKQPSFSDFTLKLSFANPSLSVDAATPTLSGPVAAASVWLFKSVVGSLPGTTGDLIADRIDNMALGSIGDNLTLRRAIIPVTWDRAWRVLTSDEREKQEITAIHQAIAYNQANGNPLPVDATPEEKYEYIKGIKISAHNVVALRNILGLTPIPFGIGVQESKEVPDYLKEVGFTSVRQEFFDIYENLIKAPNPRQDDLYEEALVTFIGSNPNRLVYTVSRNDKVREIAFLKTDAVKDWTIKNQKLIDTYGDVAFLLAPDIGDFSPSSYAWFEAAGLLKSRDLESFLNEVQVAVDRQLYFDAEDRAFEQLSKTLDINKRAMIKANASRVRESLRIANPFLDYALQQGDFGISKQEEMFKQLKIMLADPDLEISVNDKKKLVSAIEIVDDSLQFFDYQTNVKPYNYVKNKKIYRNQAIADLKKLSLGDANISSARKVIFEPMLRFKSRDVL